MRRFSYLTLFFPSINFGLGKAEIFPWPFFVVLLHRLRLKKDDFVLLFLFLFSLSISIVMKPDFSTIATAASYLNPLLAYIFIKNGRKIVFENIIKIIPYLFWFFSCLGVAQYLGLLTALDPLFEFLVSRGGSTVFGAGRGVMLLSTEPSRAGVEYVFITALYLMVTRSFKMRMYIIILGTLITVFIIKSSVALLFLGLLLYLSKPKISLIVFSIVIMFLTVSMSILDLTNFRSLSILISILSSDNLDDSLLFLLQQSGFRFISVYSAYVYSLSEVIGLGIGSWIDVAAESYKLAGFNAEEISFFRFYHDSKFVSLKPTAYFALVALELGLPGLMVGISYIAVQFKYRSQIRYNNEKPIIGLFFIAVFVLGSVGNPIYWMAFAIALRFQREQLC